MKTEDQNTSNIDDIMKNYGWTRIKENHESICFKSPASDSIMWLKNSNVPKEHATNYLHILSLIHNIDGPAVLTKSGEGIQEHYYIDGRLTTREAFERDPKVKAKRLWHKLPGEKADIEDLETIFNISDLS